MIRLVIVEDDQNYIRILEKYIHRYQEERNERFQIIKFPDGEDIIENYSGNYDIILMDIEMQFMDGMTAAQKIRKIDSEVVIIFITNMPQYAMKGYEVEALDYVLKPINYYALSQRIDKALKRMGRRTKKYMNISYRGGVRKVDISSISYIEVSNHDLIYHTDETELVVRGSMKNIEEALKGEPFFRCNKCYLINLEYVDGIEGNDVLLGKERVQVSRARKKLLMDALNDYMNEVSK